MFAALAFVLLAAPAPAAPAPAPGEGGLCQAQFSLGENFDVLVNLTVDGVSRVQDDELDMSGDFEAVWQLGRASLAGRTAMTSFAYFMDFAPDAAFPVSISATADGRPFWTGRMTEPNRNNGDGHGGIRPMLLVGEQGAGLLPNIFGVRRLRFVATDARGRIVARGRPRLPDWSAVARRTRRAIRENEQARREGCPAETLPV